jgi:hypothetical protein
VFNSAYFAHACTLVRAALLTHPKTTIKLTLAPERKEPMRDTGCSPQIHVDQFRPVIWTLFEIREGRSITLNEMPDDDDIADAIRAVMPLDDIGIESGPGPDLGNTPSIEYDEGTLPGSNWTHRRLKKLACWPKWKRAEMIQLESMKKDGMYAPPCIAPSGAIVIRTVWTYYVKWDGTLKSRSCCDGSVLKGRGIAYAQTHTACISQPGMRILWAMVAIRGWIAIGANAINAFAQADPPKEPIFVRIDDQMAEWLEEVTGKRLNRTLVLPVLYALQGNPATGNSWADKVEGLLKDDLGFTSTIHETCLYLGSYGGKEFLIGRQIDDFLAVGLEEQPLRDLFQYLATKINIVAEIGLVSHYNGIDIVQERDYVKIHVGKYIGKILANHGWEQGTKAESRLIEPLHPSAFKELVEKVPPTEPSEKAELERVAGFAYRTAIGELMYTYVTCRLDVGYAMAELSKFSCGPGACHYAAAKRVFRYLRQTQYEGLVYWRPNSRLDLPHVPLICRTVDEVDLKLPYPTEIDQLAAYVDAAHANCSKTHWSLGAEVFCLAGAAVYYHAKWIIVVCTSSTEA